MVISKLRKVQSFHSSFKQLLKIIYQSFVMSKPRLCNTVWIWTVPLLGVADINNGNILSGFVWPHSGL